MQFSARRGRVARFVIPIIAVLSIWASAFSTAAVGQPAPPPPNTDTTITAPAFANGPFTATVTFSEPVTGFDIGDIVVGNGTASGLSGSGANYAATITPRSHAIALPRAVA